MVQKLFYKEPDFNFKKIILLDQLDGLFKKEIKRAYSNPDFPLNSIKLTKEYMEYQIMLKEITK